MNRNNKGQFVKTLTDDERRIKNNENTKKWALANKERRKEIEKKTKSRPEYKKRAAELSKKRYHEGKDVESRDKYQKSEKGQIASKKAKRKWDKNNKDKKLEIGRRLISNLSDGYVKQKLRAKGFCSEEIEDNPELVEVHKIIIKTKRLCKTLKN